MNDTIGENGPAPSRLVPRFPILNSDIPTQNERMDVIKTAQQKWIRLSPKEGPWYPQREIYDRRPIELINWGKKSLYIPKEKEMVLDAKLQ